MTDKRKDIVLRFGIVYVLICLLFIFVLYNVVIIQFWERDEWLKLAAKTKTTNIVVRPNRGNIYACDGRLMASSIPTYYVYMDLRVPALHENRGKLFTENIDSVAYCLSTLFGYKTPQEYKIILQKAYAKKEGAMPLHPDRISYAQLKQLRTFPLFRLGRNKSGLITKEMFERIKPFGSLATRTIGDIYADWSKGGKNGIEKGYDFLLCGKKGISVRQKLANTYMEKIQVPPVDGMDITTTIDIDIQDIAEKALLDSLYAFDASVGYAVLMEVKTGKIKAIVNMQKNSDNSYTENKNGVVSDMIEPGSTFKVLALMVALDEGKVKITDNIETGNGLFAYGDKTMKDHNANTGGYGTISVAQTIHASSNVGVSKIITHAYGSNPSAFVDKLYDMQLHEPIKLGIPGTATPYIPHPKNKAKYWSATTLAWMSIGYEVQIPPIYTLAYYNAIANNGRFIHPLLVESISKNGQIVKTFRANAVKESICKPSTLGDIQQMLLGVVEGEFGTAKNVHSQYVRIAGKTGTAQISKGVSGYKTGGVSHQVSFCGYFPADNPKYSCIVVIREPKKGYPSGGKMAGSVFKTIAEKTMALKSTKIAKVYTKDTSFHHPKQPYIKAGYYGASYIVAHQLQLPLRKNTTTWSTFISYDNSIQSKPIDIYSNIIPNLKGMGAKDALYLLEKMGLKVRVKGRGKVVSQSIMPGIMVKKDTFITIIFQ